MSDIQISRRTLLDRYCARENAKPEAFATAVFRKCLYPHVRPFAWLIALVNPGFFGSDFIAIHDIGNAKNMLELHAEIGSFGSKTGRSNRLLHDTLKFRISGKLLEKFGSEYLENVKSRTRSQ